MTHNLLTYTRINKPTWKKVSRAFLSLQPIGNWTQDELMERMRSFIKKNHLTGDEESLLGFADEEPLIIAIPKDEASVHSVWVGKLSDARKHFACFDQVKSIDGPPQPEEWGRL